MQIITLCKYWYLTKDERSVQVTQKDVEVPQNQDIWYFCFDLYDDLSLYWTR